MVLKLERATKSPGDRVKSQVLTQQVWGGASEDADDADTVCLWTTCENQELNELWLRVLSGAACTVSVLGVLY